MLKSRFILKGLFYTSRLSHHAFFDEERSYVEIFVRYNGIQIVAADITSDGVTLDNVRIVYSLDIPNLKEECLLEVRYYTHLNGIP